MQIIGPHPDQLNQKLNKVTLLFPTHYHVWEALANDIHTKRPLEVEDGICERCVLIPQMCHFRWYLCNSQSIGKLQWPPSWHVDHWKSLFPMNLWAGKVFRGVLSYVTTLDCQATRRWWHPPGSFALVGERKPCLGLWVTCSDCSMPQQSFS